MSRIGELQLDIDKTAGNVVQLLVSKGNANNRIATTSIKAPSKKI